MIGVGTSVYSVMFFVGAAMFIFLFGRYMYKTWRGYIVSKESGADSPLITPIFKTIVAVGLTIVVLTLGWNIKQSVTTSMSRYENPVEKAEQKKIQESQLPPTEELDQTRAEQKQRAETKPHQDTLDSFNESMRKEAEKIQKRSLATTEESAPSDVPDTDKK